MVSIPTRWDKSNVYSSVLKLPDQLGHAWAEAQTVVLPSDYLKIKQAIFTGMGGSLLGARLIKSVFGNNFRVPLILVNDYKLPDWTGPETLVIASSYSGSTEETLSCARQALAQKAALVIIAAGGELIELAKNNHLPYYRIEPRFNPSNQPRMAIGYSAVGQLALCQKAGLIQISQADLASAVTAMKAVNPVTAETTAKALADKEIILTAAEHLTGAVHTVKNQINENAKHLAHRHDLPELNHHLMEGLRFPSGNPGTVAFWFIDSDLYSARIRRRLDLTREVIAKNRLQGETLKLTGPTPLSQAFELIQSGAYVAFYLSQLHQLDPAPIPWVDYFKQHLT